MQRTAANLLVRSSINATKRAYTTIPPTNPTSPEIQPKTGHVQDPLPRQDSIKTPKTNPSGGGNGPLLFGALAVAGVGAYYYYRSPEEKDAKGHARSAAHEADASLKSAKREAEDRMDKAKDRTKEDIDARASQAQSTAQQARDSATAKYDQAKAGVVQTYDSVKQNASAKVEDAKHTAQHAKESVENTASSWWSWGSGKADETKSQAAEKVEEGANKVRYEARKRE